MPTKKTSTAGSELFIVDNSDENWKACQNLRDWRLAAGGVGVENVWR